MKEKYKIQFFLCLFLGFLGIHKFYESDVEKGILYFFTGGLLGIGWIYDTIVLVDLAFFGTEESLKQREIVLKQKKLIKQQEKKEIQNQYIQAKEERKNSKEACCPRCGSTSLTANKKGFSLGKAVAGGVILAPIAGVATGMIGKNKIIITCLKCGKQFKPGR